MTEKIEIHKIDANGKKLGRLATEIATVLMGKHRPDAVKNTVANVLIEVKNASKLLITEKKKKEKTYTHYTGYPGGLRLTTMEKMIEKKGCAEVLRKAVYGMLPNNRLRARRMKRLKVSE